MTAAPGDGSNPDGVSSLSDDDVLPDGRAEGSDANDPDGQMDDQQMPTADGQMSSNSSEEVIPPRA